MPECEFSEKTYEKLMDYYLTHDGKIFSPDIKLENYVGFDSAYFTNNNIIWNMFPVKLGQRIDHTLWNDPEKILKHRNAFPPFRLNLFIQYKIPFHVTQSNGWPESNRRWNYWNQEYYRIELDLYQLFQLRTLEQNTYGKAIVAYAAPAFSTRNEIWEHNRNQTVIDNSHFVEPVRLLNHDLYTYIDRLTPGKALSEPEEIPILNLSSRIETMLTDVRSYDSNYQFIEILYASIEKTILESEIENEPLDLFLEYRYSDVDIVNKIAKISFYCLMMDLSWSIVT